MARGKKDAKRRIDNYVHTGRERLNNPSVGLVTPDTDKDAGKKTYAYDPHLDPQLVWAGKAEHTSFKVPTVSLHVHERIDPLSIIEAVKRRNGTDPQLSLFAAPEENRPIRHAIEFYKHAQNWTNRLIAGDSLLVMNSLLEKEGMAGKVQMVYIDPPYGIRYGSNFQPFVNKRDVKDGKDEDLNQEPEMIKAFRDTWELGIHSYLTYLRDRLLLARELLHDSGSVFVQIGDENLHRVRTLLDEVFGSHKFHALITFKKTAGLGTEGISAVCDYLLWYCKDPARLKARTLFREQNFSDDPNYVWLMGRNGTKRRMSDEERSTGIISAEHKLFRHQIFLAAGLTPSCVYAIAFNGDIFRPTAGRSWSTNADGTKRLIEVGRLTKNGNTVNYVRYTDDFPYVPISNPIVA